MHLDPTLPSCRFARHLVTVCCPANEATAIRRPPSIMSRLACGTLIWWCPIVEKHNVADGISQSSQDDDLEIQGICIYTKFLPPSIGINSISTLLKPRAQMKRFRNSGFTLTELAIALVIIALLVGSTFSIFQALTSQIERRETSDKLAQLRESISGFAMTTGRIPSYAPAGVDELSALLPNATDFWGRKLVYIYDPELARKDVDRVICAKKTSNIVAMRCEDAACSAPIVQKNVAFLVFSIGKNGRNQTDASATPRIEAAPFLSLSGPVGGFGSSNLKTSILFRQGIQIGDYGSPAVNPAENDDMVAVVTLEELRQKLQCQGLPLKIVNSDLPVGANLAPYNASIVADGGVPVAVVGKYRWCAESTNTVTMGTTFDLAVTNNASPTVIAKAANTCLTTAESGWVQGDSLGVKGKGVGGIVTSAAQTYDLTVFVRDNQNADAAPPVATDPDDNIVSRRFVIGINGA